MFMPPCSKVLKNVLEEGNIEGFKANIYIYFFLAYIVRYNLTINTRTQD